MKAMDYKTTYPKEPIYDFNEWNLYIKSCNG